MDFHSKMDDGDHCIALEGTATTSSLSLHLLPMRSPLYLVVTYKLCVDSLVLLFFVVTMTTIIPTKRITNASIGYKIYQNYVRFPEDIIYTILSMANFYKENDRNKDCLYNMLRTS